MNQTMPHDRSGSFGRLFQKSIYRYFSVALHALGFTLLSVRLGSSPISDRPGKHTPKVCVCWASCPEIFSPIGVILENFVFVAVPQLWDFYKSALQIPFGSISASGLAFVLAPTCVLFVLV
jgi:hypothetical protein